MKKAYLRTLHLALILSLMLACSLPSRIIAPAITTPAPAEPVEPVEPKRTPVSQPTATGTSQPAQTQPPQILRPGTQQPLQPPNILFILTDDLDAAAYETMPRLKELLVDQGVSLPNFFANVPLCCPARASILLGQYSHNTNILTNDYPDGGFRAFYERGLEQNTIAVALQSAGYRTALLGKYLNGYPKGASPEYIPPGWTEWYSPAAGKPYDEYNYTLNANGQLVEYGNDPGDYLTDVLAGLAGDFIRTSAAAKQPFFAYLATYAPHTPSTPAPRHKDLFERSKAPRTPSFNEGDVKDKPASIRARRPLDKYEIEEIDDLYVKRLQSLQAVDEMVVALVSLLQETGQLDNTYIFFTSDNGFHLGVHRLGIGKKTPYEEDIRVPLVARGPGIPAGVVLDALAGNIDLAPTFAEIAGLPAVGGYDGRSLLPLFHTPDTPPAGWRQAYLLEQWTGDSEEEAGLPRAGVLGLQYDQLSGLFEPPDALGWPGALSQENVFLPFKGLRTVDSLYVEYEGGEKELYNLKADPYELDNLAGSADESLMAQLSAWLARLAACAGQECQAAENRPP